MLPAVLETSHNGSCWQNCSIFESESELASFCTKLVQQYASTMTVYERSPLHHCLPPYPDGRTIEVLRDSIGNIRINTEAPIGRLGGCIGQPPFNRRTYGPHQRRPRRPAWPSGLCLLPHEFMAAHVSDCSFEDSVRGRCKLGAVKRGSRRTNIPALSWIERPRAGRPRSVESLCIRLNIIYPRRVTHGKYAMCFQRRSKATGYRCMV